ncbi:MAG: DEAD/DEAH box helicase family protein [Natronomonas sp.]
MVTLRYEDGTLRIEADSVAADLLERHGAQRDDRSETLRAPAYRYPAIVTACESASVSVTDEVLSLESVGPLHSTYELRSYQESALDAWLAADNRGVVELPTGAGKTVIAIAAIERLSTPTLVVVPTVDLLEQWHAELEAEFDEPIGRLGGGSQTIESITVSTYDSAYLRAEELGNRFGLLVFDEAHHLGGEGYRDAARLSAAPARLGLTATFERPDGAHEAVADLLGDVVYRLDPDDLAGEHLADYDIKRIEVELTDEERRRYERHQETFTDYLAASGLRLESGSDYQKLVKRSGTDPKAREALLAKQRAREVMLSAERKRDALGEILRRHRGERIIVFAAHTEVVYDVAERFLIPPITAETAAEERRYILDRFRRGTYTRVVAANVLDEGIDVPDANVGVILSGSGSKREFTQRLGRILRPNDDGSRAVLYEVVAADTVEENIAGRRR